MCGGKVLKSRKFTHQLKLGILGIKVLRGIYRLDTPTLYRNDCLQLKFNQSCDIKDPTVIIPGKHPSNLLLFSQSRDLNGYLVDKVAILPTKYNCSVGNTTAL